ncbi:MAG: dihydrofolate reductase region, partial [Paenibacillus sp.]|nr:dihydrofolate reductase region [Paenibacillus sp.]
MSEGRPPISMILAMSRNRVIGKDNKIPWRLPAEQAYFKQTTMGHPVIMGRKTYESIGKPLVGRTNIVVTRDRSYTAEGCLIAHTPEEALSLAGKQSPFVIGGSELYERYLPMADRLYITVVEDWFEGDAYFPEIAESDWRLISSEPGIQNEKNKHPYTFYVYERRVAA